jgi:hypothetical protein
MVPGWREARARWMFLAYEFGADQTGVGVGVGGLDGLLVLLVWSVSRQCDTSNSNEGEKE